MKYCNTIIQPSFATIGDQYKLCQINRYGILDIYSVQVTANCKQNEVQIIPDGATDILFIQKNNGMIEVYSDGTPSKPITILEHMEMEPGTILFGARMLPNVMRVMAGIDAAETIDQVIGLKNNAKLLELGMKIFSVQSFSERVTIFIDRYIAMYYEPYFEQVEHNRLAFYMQTEITRSNGLAKIKDLSVESGYTVQYMNKIFSSEYGMSPKKYSRIVRVQAILQELMTSKRIIDISEEFGMSEVNLIREFRSMLECTPGKYRNILMEYQVRLTLLQSSKSVPELKW